MPRVQTYGGPQVRRQPLPGVKQTTISPVGEGLAKLGDQVTAIAARALDARMQRLDQATTQEAWNSLSLQRQQLEQWGLSQKGKDSFDIESKLDQQFTEAAGKIEGTLKNDRQRLTFARMRASQQESLRGTLFSHVRRQEETYYEQQTKAGLDLAVSDAVAHAADPMRVSQELARGKAMLRDHLKGQSPEAVDAAVQEFQTQIHGGVIEQLLATNQDRAAKAYFEETKDQISGQSIAKIERALEVGSTLGEAQRQSDAIIRAGGTLTEQREKAKAIDDPEVRDRALSYIEHEAAIRKAEAQVNEENLMVTAGNLIDKGGIKAVPPGLWSQLTPSQKSGLESYAKRNLQGGDGDSSVETWNSLYQMATTDPEKFKTLNLMDYIHKLSKSDFKEFSKLQANVRKGDKAATDAQLDGFRTNQQIVDDTLDLAGIPRTGTGKDATAVAQFRKTLDEKVIALQRITGKKATNEDIQQIADDLLKSVVVQKGSWLNILPGGQPFNDVTKRLSDLTVGDIPARDRAQIEQALRAHGRPVNFDTILNLYIDTKRRTGDLK